MALWWWGLRATTAVLIGFATTSVHRWKVKNYTEELFVLHHTIQLVHLIFDLITWTWSGCWEATSIYWLVLLLGYIYWMTPLVLLLQFTSTFTITHPLPRQTTVIFSDILTAPLLHCLGQQMVLAKTERAAVTLCKFLLGGAFLVTTLSHVGIHRQPTVDEVVEQRLGRQKG